MADGSGKPRYETVKTRRVRIGNLQNKTNLYRRTCSVIYFAIVPPWLKQNRHRIDIAVFHFAIKKVQLVRMAKKLDFLISRPISLRGINDCMRFEETRANISPSQILQKCVLYILNENTSRRL